MFIINIIIFILLLYYLYYCYLYYFINIVIFLIIMKLVFNINYYKCLRKSILSPQFFPYEMGKLHFLACKVSMLKTNSASAHRIF